MKIIIATHNKHKLQEMSRILSPMGYEVVTDRDLGIELSDVEENGESILSAIEDDEELEAVYSLIMDQLYEEEDEE